MKAIFANFPSLDVALWQQALARFSIQALPTQLVDPKETNLPMVALRFLWIGESSDLGMIETLKQNEPCYLILIMDQMGIDFQEACLAGADDFLLFGQDEKNIKAVLALAVHSLERKLQIGLDQSAQQSVLDPVVAMDSLNQDPAAMGKLLPLLINEAKRLAQSPVKEALEALSELEQQAGTMGAQALTEVIRLILNLGLGESEFSIGLWKLASQGLESSAQSLSKAMDSLDSLGFFRGSAPGVDTSPLEGKRILLVEDLPFNRLLIQKILKKFHCQVTEAENGEEALRKTFEAKPFDLVLMDMNMPVMDGFESMAKIRQKEATGDFKPVPILALTALAMQGDEKKCLEAGCDDYFAKPVEMQPFVRACEKLLLKQGTIASDEEHSQMAFVSRIRRVLMLESRAVYAWAFKAFFKSMGVGFKVTASRGEVIRAVLDGNCDMVILDGDRDLELAYQLKNRSLFQEVILIHDLELTETAVLLEDSTGVFCYPFEHEQVRDVFFRHCAQWMEKNKEAADLQTGRMIDRISGVMSVEQCSRQTEGQIEVWQRSLGKVGGDLVMSRRFNLHGRLGFILADVSGHDVNSAYTASWFSGLVKGCWGNHGNPVDLLTFLNAQFDYDETEQDRCYVCALVLVWDPVRGTLSYANAGIPGGMLIKDGGREKKMLEWTGVPLGLFDQVDKFDHGVLLIEANDRLLLATDGVLENIPTEVLAGLDDSGSLSTREALEKVVDFVTRSILIRDDLTLALFDPRFLPEPAKGLRFTIRSDISEVESAVDRLIKAARSYVKQPMEWNLIRIALHEGLINAIHHGNHQRMDDLVDLDLVVEEEGFTVMISDLGSGFDLFSVKRQHRQAGNLREHGRGIDLMKNIAQTVQYVGGGLRLRFTSKPEQDAKKSMDVNDNES